MIFTVQIDINMDRQTSLCCEFLFPTVKHNLNYTVLKTNYTALKTLGK